MDDVKKLFLLKDFIEEATLYEVLGTNVELKPYTLTYCKTQNLYDPQSKTYIKDLALGSGSVEGVIANVTDEELLKLQLYLNPVRYRLVEPKHYARGIDGIKGLERDISAIIFEPLEDMERESEGLPKPERSHEYKELLYFSVVNAYEQRHLKGEVDVASFGAEALKVRRSSAHKDGESCRLANFYKICECTITDIEKLSKNSYRLAKLAPLVYRCSLGYGDDEDPECPWNFNISCVVAPGTLNRAIVLIEEPYMWTQKQDGRGFKSDSTITRTWIVSHLEQFGLQLIGGENWIKDQFCILYKPADGNDLDSYNILHEGKDFTVYKYKDIEYLYDGNDLQHESEDHSVRRLLYVPTEPLRLTLNNFVYGTVLGATFAELAETLLHALRSDYDRQWKEEKLEKDEKLSLDTLIKKTIETLDVINYIEDNATLYPVWEEEYDLARKLKNTEKHLERSEKLYKIIQNKKAEKYNKLVSILLLIMSLIQFFPLLYELLNPVPIFSNVMRYAVSASTCFIILIVYIVFINRKESSE
jgi:hypothetical protein